MSRHRVFEKAWTDLTKVELETDFMRYFMRMRNVMHGSKMYDDLGHLTYPQKNWSVFIFNKI